MENPINETLITPEAMVEQLRTLRLQIPEYTQLPNADAATMRRAANINADFVQATFESYLVESG